MENTASVTSSMMQQTFTSSDEKPSVAPIQHQQKGFFQMSQSDNSYLANTYTANGELPKASATSSSESGFNKTF